MFKARQKRSFLRKIKELVWPSMGFARAAKYLALKILRLSDADGHDVIAQSVALGTSISFFPIPGVHALIAAALAALFKCRIVVSTVATLLVPPVVLPVVFSLDFLVGRQVLKAFGLAGWGSQASFDRNIQGSDWAWLQDHFYELFLPSLIGFILFMPMVWCASYMATHKVMDILRRRYRLKHGVAP